MFICNRREWSKDPVAKGWRSLADCLQHLYHLLHVTSQVWISQYNSNQTWSTPDTILLFTNINISSSSWNLINVGEKFAHLTSLHPINHISWVLPPIKPSSSSPTTILTLWSLASQRTSTIFWELRFLSLYIVFHCFSGTLIWKIGWLLWIVLTTAIIQNDCQYISEQFIFHQKKLLFFLKFQLKQSCLFASATSAPIYQQEPRQTVGNITSDSIKRIHLQNTFFFKTLQTKF